MATASADLARNRAVPTTGSLTWPHRQNPLILSIRNDGAAYGPSAPPGMDLTASPARPVITSNNRPRATLAEESSTDKKWQKRIGRFGASFRQHLDPLSGPDALRITAPAGPPGQPAMSRTGVTVQRRLPAALPLSGILAEPIQGQLKSASIELRFIFNRVKRDYFHPPQTSGAGQ